MSTEVAPEETKLPVETSAALMPLTPRYDRSQHSVYVEAVVGALSNSRKLRWWQWVAWVERFTDRVNLDRSHWWRSWQIQTPGEGIRNVALTGGYGVGKSSILQEVARRYKRKVVQVSLSTLSPEVIQVAQANAPVDTATTVSVDSQLNPASTSKTNQIQKEIVKQLLYREEPAKMPGSRFKRIGRFQLRRAAGISIVAGLVATVVFFLAGWTERLSTLEQIGEMGLWIHVAVFAAASLGAWVSNGKV